MELRLCDNCDKKSVSLAEFGKCPYCNETFFAPPADATPAREGECEHDWVTWMIQMPQGYAKPGATKCQKCGAYRGPTQFTVSTGSTPARDPRVDEVIEKLEQALRLPTFGVELCADDGLNTARCRERFPFSEYTWCHNCRREADRDDAIRAALALLRPAKEDT